MNIAELMSSKVRACAPTDSLGTAAHLMWEGDCGIVPVVDLEGRPVGVVTDRDVCMSALFNGTSLGETPVAQAMSRQLETVRASDSIHTALERMRTHQLRRLIVVDDESRLAGVLSLADVARGWERREGSDDRELRADDVARTLAGVCSNQSEGPTAVMVVEVTPPARRETAGDSAAQTAEPTRRSRAAKAGKRRAAQAGKSRSKPKKA